MERYQVVEEKMKILEVTVLRARGVTVGISDLWDTPDPYVKLRVLTSPNAKQQTTSKGDETNPEWGETFTFYLNSEKKNTLELIIMDDDFGFDDTVGRETVELDDLPIDEDTHQEIQFGKKTSLDVKLRITDDKSMQLRFGYDLCNEEKDFVNKRKEEIFRNMSKVLQVNELPNSVDEVPTIAIMGSGGGYRAMCGLSGVFCALQETGILDCATYVSGLSGSAWYISTLYSHEGWPNSISCQDFAKGLRKKFDSSFLSHFNRSFVKTMREKRRNGQPVAFTDLFGMAIGNALLENRYTTLSHQVQKVKYGETPLPICTGLRVWENLSAKEFSEWIEFSPFEYGLAKYGLFGKTADFGAKFYKGHLVQKFDEVPLSYLQGIWGSAYSILLDRVVGHGDEKNTTVEKESEITTKKVTELAHERLIKDAVNHGKNEGDDSDDERDNLPEDDMVELGVGSWLKAMLKPANIFHSHMGKAAEVLNVCRGLKFTSSKDDGLIKHHFGKKKTTCIVDSGLAFNSPYPTVLRAERNVDLILSFDFSQRDGGDHGLPFIELLDAEKWAKEHGIPFPPVAENPITRHNNIRECYVFENSDDPKCPTILHFVIINNTFKDYIAPGVPRVTEKEKDFANFSIFDDPKEPYSSFTFHYDNKRFDRLHELMHYNTLLNMDLIKENIASQVIRLRNNKKKTVVDI